MCRIVQALFSEAGRLRILNAVFFSPVQSIPREGQEQPLFLAARNQIASKAGFKRSIRQNAKLIQHSQNPVPLRQSTRALHTRGRHRLARPGITFKKLPLCIEVTFVPKLHGPSVAALAVVALSAHSTFACLIWLMANVFACSVILVCRMI